MVIEKSKFDIVAPFYDIMMKLLFMPSGGESKFRKKISQLARIRSNHKILDVGCGTGTLTISASAYLEKGISIGLDLSHRMLTVAKSKSKNPRIHFILGNSSKMPFRSGSFDRVFLTFVLHELSPVVRQQTLKEVRRVLKPDGLLIAVDYHVPKGKLKRVVFRALMMLEEDEAWNFVARGLAKELKSAGFQINRTEFTIKDLVSVVIANPVCR